MGGFEHKKEHIKKQLENCNSEKELQNLLSSLYCSINSVQQPVLGKYSIQGLNQDEYQSPYSGQLEIKANTSGQLKAIWLIGKDQLQFGTGFMHDNLIVFNFYYEGEAECTGQLFKGVVVYKQLPTGDLNGFWSEKHGDQRFLGKEFAKRLTNTHTDFSLN